MSGNKGPAEPSMDDILASIRKILNEDETTGSPGNAPLPPPPAEPLMLTEDMLVAESVAAAAPIVAPPPPAPPPAPPPPPPPPVAVAPPPPVMPRVEPPMPVESNTMAPTDLVAPAAAAAAAASVSQLMRAVSQDRGTPVARGTGPTIEDIVREEMRPLLKEWLDAHLPAIVDRAVKAEIERVVARGG